MSRRKLSAFLDALAAGRRPRGFRASPRRRRRPAHRHRPAGRPPRRGRPRPPVRLAPPPGAGRPGRDRSSRPHGAPPASGPRRPGVGGRRARPGGSDRGRHRDHRSAGVDTGRAATAHTGQDLRTGTFEDAASQNLGQIVVYDGNPSWVFMVVKGSSYDGPVTCRLHATNGSTVTTGAFYLHDGTGQLAKTIRARRRPTRRRPARHPHRRHPSPPSLKQLG